MSFIFDFLRVPSRPSRIKPFADQVFSMAKPEHYLITCEHGGNRIPPRFRSLFAGFEALLQTHRGHDPGALALARELAGALAAPLFVSTTSTSPSHAACWAFVIMAT